MKNDKKEDADSKTPNGAVVFHEKAQNLFCYWYTASDSQTQGKIQWLFLFDFAFNVLIFNLVNSQVRQPR